MSHSASAAGTMSTATVPSVTPDRTLTYEAAHSEQAAPVKLRQQRFQWPFLLLVLAALLSIGLGLLEYDRDPMSRGYDHMESYSE
jgi:hypothetical protein